MSESLENWPNILSFGPNVIFLSPKGTFGSKVRIFSLFFSDFWCQLNINPIIKINHKVFYTLMNFDVICCLSQRKEMRLFGILWAAFYFKYARLGTIFIRRTFAPLLFFYKSYPCIDTQFTHNVAINKMSKTFIVGEKKILAIHPHKSIWYLPNWFKMMDNSKFILGYTYTRTPGAEVEKGLGMDPRVHLQISQ